MSSMSRTHPSDKGETSALREGIERRTVRMESRSAELEDQLNRVLQAGDMRSSAMSNDMQWVIIGGNAENGTVAEMNGAAAGTLKRTLTVQL